MNTCEKCKYSEIPDRFSEPEVFWCSEYSAMLCVDCARELERNEPTADQFEVEKFHFENIE